MVKTCPVCKKIYAQTPFGMCYDCREKELEDEDTVREYVRENARSSIEQIATNTGVRLETIKKMMKSGRLQGEAQIEYPCEKCRKPITEGRLCYECTQSIKSQMEVIKEKQAEASQAKKTEDGNTKKRRGMYIDNVYK